MPLPGKTTSLGFIYLVLLARFLVILSSLSFLPHILSLPPTIIGNKCNTPNVKHCIWHLHFMSTSIIQAFMSMSIWNFILFLHIITCDVDYIHAYACDNVWPMQEMVVRSQKHLRHIYDGKWNNVVFMTWANFASKCWFTLNAFYMMLVWPKLNNSLDCLHGSAPWIKVVAYLMGNKLYSRVMS